MGLFSSMAEVAGIVATPIAITAEAVGEVAKGVVDEVVEPMVEMHKEVAGDLVDGLSDALEDIKADYTVLTKGTNEDREEYSVFKNTKSCVKLINLCNLLDITEIDICGIAFDYCLKDSAKDGMRYLENVKFNVIKEFSPSIAEDSENEFIGFINNCERIKLI